MRGDAWIKIKSFFICCYTHSTLSCLYKHMINKPYLTCLGYKYILLKNTWQIQVIQGYRQEIDMK